MEVCTPLACGVMEYIKGDWLKPGCAAGAYTRPEPFLSLTSAETTQHNYKCSRRAEKLTSVSPWCAVIDVGINAKDDPSKKRGYRLVGDADFEECSKVAGFITPVPGRGFHPSTSYTST